MKNKAQKGSLGPILESYRSQADRYFYSRGHRAFFVQEITSLFLSDGALCGIYCRGLEKSSCREV